MIESVYPDPATALPLESPCYGNSPRCRAANWSTRYVGNRARRRSLDAGGTGAAPRRDDRVRAAGRGFCRRGRATVRAPRRAMAVDDRVVRSVGGLGPERTLEWDPMFAFRIIVDIALSAIAGDQRSNDRRACPRPGASVTAIGCQRKLRGEVIVDERAAARHLPHAELGTTFKSPAARFVPAARQTPGRAPHARDAREPPQGAAGTPSRRAGHRTRLVGLGDSNALPAVPRNSRWPAFPIRRVGGSMRTGTAIADLKTPAEPLHR
jgi:hypothetical protein